jgi:hypothetical protein
MSDDGSLRSSLYERRSPPRNGSHRQHIIHEERRVNISCLHLPTTCPRLVGIESDDGDQREIKRDFQTRAQNGVSRDRGRANRLAPLREFGCGGSQPALFAS